MEIGYWKEKTMGYRSDVAYTIRFVDDHDTNNEQSFYTFLLEAKANPKCQIALSEVEINHKKQEFNFVAISVKWYENFPEVISHCCFVRASEIVGRANGSAETQLQNRCDLHTSW
jgi:hypothetical protein